MELSRQANTAPPVTFITIMGGLAERLFYNHAHSMLHHLWRNLLSVVWRSDGKQIFKSGKNQVTYKNAIKHVTGALPWYGQHGDLFRPATDTRAKRLTRCQRYRTVNQKPLRRSTSFCRCRMAACRPFSPGAARLSAGRHKRQMPDGRKPHPASLALTLRR